MKQNIKFKTFLKRHFEAKRLKWNIENNSLVNQAQNNQYFTNHTNNSQPAQASSTSNSSQFNNLIESCNNSYGQNIHLHQHHHHHHNQTVYPNTAASFPQTGNKKFKNSKN